MSVLSDDTDVLLLIPPDFFFVPSDVEEEDITSTKSREQLLVSDLLSQVNDLEGRICLIENHNIQMAKNGNLQHLKRFGSADALNTSYRSNYNSRSLQSTPLKTQTLPSPCKSWRLGLNNSSKKLKKNIEDHQNMLTSSNYKSQKEKDDQILKEIHSFFRHRDCNDVDNARKDEEKSVLESEENGNIHLSTAVFNLNKVHGLLKQLEETQAEIEQKLKLRGLTGAEDNSRTSDLCEKDVLTSARHFSEDSANEGLVNGKTTKRFLNFNDLSPKRNGKYFDVSQEHVMDNECSSQDLNLNTGKSIPNSEINENKTVEITETKLSNDLTDFLNLCSMWNSAPKADDPKCFEDVKQVRQKYQEEMFRRQHCEELIQKLQMKLLEEQQKVAVAIKVDQEKDEAISKLTEGWNKLVNHWRNLENQRCNLEKKLVSERERFEKEVTAACQTVKRYEMELSKALDLAHGYKEKCETSEMEKNNVSINAGKEIEALKSDLKIIKEKFESQKIHIEKLEKLLVTKEENLSQVMTRLCDMQNQLRDQVKIMKEQQAEVAIIKKEKEKYCDKLKVETNRISGLEQSKKILLQSNEELKKKEKSLKETIKTMTDQVEKIKVELKEFYQNQVEKIVQEKLKEFQEQLSVAERTLQKEIEERERTISDMAVKQVQQIVEKHVVEVKILEEKHKEEMELWKVKFIRAEKRINELQKKLDQHSSQKKEIAYKLQTVMEAQWQEALKIITASSPQQSRNSLDRCNKPENGLTRQNTFTVTTCGLGEEDLNKNGLPTDAEQPSLSPIPESPFCQEGQITFRNRLKSETETSNGNDDDSRKVETQGQDDPLRKYIQMLLERPPGLPVEDADKSVDTNALFDLSASFNAVQWQQILADQPSQELSISSKLKDSYKQLEDKLLWK